MSQLTLNTANAGAPRDRIRGIARAAAPYAVAATLIAALLVERLVVIAVANRQVMEAFRETLLRAAAAMGMAG